MRLYIQWLVAGVAAGVGFAVGWLVRGSEKRARASARPGGDPVVQPELEERVDPRELVGESEYSVRMASDPDALEREEDENAEDEDPISVDADDLGRHFLEEATESPAHREPGAPRGEERRHR
jgi:hypothetical protein